MAEIIAVENKMLGEKYYTFKHKTGLPVYVFPKKMTTSYALFATKYGAIDNKFKLSSDDEFTSVPDGIAHFLEHKMFECEDGSDAFELYAKTGASANAYTSNHMTAYLFSATERFYESLEILLDVVTHPYFTKETVEKEQGIIGEEIKMYDDHAGARLEKGLLEALYKYNKMRIDIAGTQESISKIDADLLYRCYNVFYNLNNMALVVCGDVDVKKVEDVCDKMLKNAPRLEIVRDYEDENEPKEVYKKRSECYLAIAKPIFTIGIKDMDIPSDAKLRTKKISAMHILNDMIFSQSGELYNTLYDSGLISHDLSYSFDMRKGSSYNQIYSESQDPEKVYDIFVKHIKKLQKNGLDKEDFELSKRTIYASFIKSFDSTEEIANNMMYSIFDDADILDTPEIITSVTYEYVSELLNTMFKEEYYAMSVVKPIQQEREEK